MNMSPQATSKYAVGVDFGTESGRAVLVDVTTGRELASSVHEYANGVIDKTLPGTTIPLGHDWALQDPNDYLEVFKTTIPAVLAESGVKPENVIGIGIDFTSCTMLPTTLDGTPLCFLPQWRDKPHAWVKLWKHHAAQPEANKLNAIARELGYTFLDRYGGKISSEWFFPKAWQILDVFVNDIGALRHIKCVRLLKAGKGKQCLAQSEQERQKCRSHHASQSNQPPFMEG